MVAALGVGLTALIASSPVGGDVVPVGCGISTSVPDPADPTCTFKRNARCVIPGFPPLEGYTNETCGTKSGSGGQPQNCGYALGTGAPC